MVGVAVFTGGDSWLGRAVVLTAGYAFRLGALALKDEFERTGPLMHLLMHYTQALIAQTSQLAVCNRHHSLDQRLCRWLLLSLDRLQSDDIVITQEMIAHMLGVRRESVTVAALKLQKLGLIQYGRGRIAVVIVGAWSSTPASVTWLLCTNTNGCCPIGGRQGRRRDSGLPPSAYYGPYVRSALTGLGQPL